MEVHHHPDLHHKKIHFKEYFLEFLMIFLAVFMGFIAENIRERISDKEKEKEYIHSFIQNLQDDTSRLNTIIAENKKKIIGLDSLVSLSFKNIDLPENRRSLYRLTGQFATYYSLFTGSDATMQQLKNSGGLRLIRKNHVADSIAKYDIEMDEVKEGEKYYNKAMDDCFQSIIQVLDFSVYYDTTYFKNGSYTNKMPPLLIYEKQKIKFFFNEVINEKFTTRNYIYHLKARLSFALRMIAFLKKEYNFE
ncbi:MAG: hypothetical protein ABI834_05800 [Ginsengibacter sp.]